jgi:hypothetical protein
MSRRLAPALLAALAILWPAAAAGQAAAPPDPEDQVVLAGSVEIPRGTSVGEVVVFSGSVVVEGVVTGDVVVFEGPVTVRGQVNGSVIAADGGITLGRSARIGGDVSSSEPIRPAAGADVAGEVQGDVRFSLEGPLEVLGALLGPVAVAVSVLLTGLTILVLAPRGADAVAETIADAPLASLGWGLVVAIAIPIAAVALSVLVLGFPLGLALLLSLALWWLVGLTLAAWGGGRALVGSGRGRVATFAAGWAILAAVGLVPVLNAIVWTLVAVLGIGAMLVAAWRGRHHGHHGGRHRHGRVTPSFAQEEAGIPSP